jgi:fructose-1,6-bisphosphatase/inositol monophosphatase family enzyme
LAEASGAIVTDEWGKPWTLGSTMLIAAATRELHAFLVELVARHFRLAE